MRQGIRNSILMIAAVLISIPSFSQLPPDRIIVGYWHNWMYSPNHFPLTDIPQQYDVVNIAFATPSIPFGAYMQFTPEVGIYPDPQDFIDDVEYLQGLSKKVLISIGGANDPVQVDDADDVEDFVNSMINIIEEYGFDGFDIDLEGSSLFLDPGDNDFRNPTSPQIVYFIEAVGELYWHFYPDFILTAAPETAFVQGGYSTYTGIWGAYLPVIHALRGELAYLHVQHYNTGSMFGRDGNIYQPATADFHTAMADMLLAGFPVDYWGSNIYFDPLEQEQVAVGLPASNQAAGSGYTPPGMVQDAVDYITLGIPYGGAYQLAAPEGYYDFRGLMTWSINWDVENNLEFAGSHRPYLDGLDTLNVRLTPAHPPIIIPAAGGQFEYEIEIANRTSSQQAFDAWTTAILYNGSEYGPFILRENLNLGAGGSIIRNMVQAVPLNAPPGEYTYNACIGNYETDEIWDMCSFMLVKQ